MVVVTIYEPGGCLFCHGDVALRSSYVIRLTTSSRNWICSSGTMVTVIFMVSG